MRLSILLSAWLGLFGLSTLTGCPSGGDKSKDDAKESSKKDDDDDDDDKKKKKGKKGKKKKKKKKGEGDDGDTAEAPEPSATASAAASAPPKEAEEAKKITLEGWHVPDSPTKPPTAKEWQSAKDVNVHNAKALGCEPRFVREWMRVSCRTGSGSDNPVTGVTMIKPKKGGEFFDFYKDYGSYAVASVVFPIRSRTHATMEYRWRDYKSTLTVRWDPSMKSPVAHFTNPKPTDDDPMRGFICDKCPIGLFYFGMGCGTKDGMPCTEGYTCVSGGCQCNAKCN